MLTNDRRRRTDTAHELASDTNDRQDDATRHCPACDAPVESVRDVGPVTWMLEPAATRSTTAFTRTSGRRTPETDAVTTRWTEQGVQTSDESQPAPRLYFLKD